MIKRISKVRTEIKVDNLSQKELKDLIIKIANKLDLEVKDKIMERFTSYFNGMEIVNIAENVSGYSYYGFNRWGREEWGIKKIKTDDTEFSYLIGTGLTEYATAWANKTSLTFASPSKFNV